MCGIAGWLDFKPRFPERVQIVEAMTKVLAHRGPNAQGIWFDQSIALGHRRLSIIDIERGTQPMEATNGVGDHAVVSFNGQIFNFKELRSELQGLG
jgi:asparagine synthetase B (glutamine-hydrolysing)